LIGGVIYPIGGAIWNKTSNNDTIPKDISLGGEKILCSNCIRCPIKLKEEIGWWSGGACWSGWRANHLEVAVKGQDLSDLIITLGVKLTDLSIFRPVIVNRSPSDFYFKFSSPTWNDLIIRDKTNLWLRKVSVNHNIGVCGISLTNKCNIGDSEAHSIRNTGTFKLENIFSNNCRYCNNSSMNAIVSRYNWENNVIIPYDSSQTGLEWSRKSGGIVKGESEGAAGLRSWGDKHKKKNGKKNCFHLLLL